MAMWTTAHYPIENIVELYQAYIDGKLCGAHLEEHGKILDVFDHLMADFRGNRRLNCFCCRRKIWPVQVAGLAISFAAFEPDVPGHGMAICAACESEGDVLAKIRKRRGGGPSIPSRRA
jgi:hypothetical protein